MAAVYLLSVTFKDGKAGAAAAPGQKEKGALAALPLAAPAKVTSSHTLSKQALRGMPEGSAAAAEAARALTSTGMPAGPREASHELPPPSALRLPTSTALPSPPG